MNKFKNASAVLTTSVTNLYTCDSTNGAVVHTLFFTTINVNGNSNVTIQIYDNSTNNTITLGHLLPVISNTTLSFDKPINLENGDILKVSATVNNEVHCFASILYVPSSIL